MLNQRPRLHRHCWLFASLVLLAACGGGSGSGAADDSEPESGLDAQDVSGTWRGTTGSVVESVTIEQVGEMLQGSVDNAEGTHALTGSVFGYDAVWTFSQAAGLCEARVNCFATRFDLELRGSCKVVTTCATGTPTTKVERLALKFE